MTRIAVVDYGMGNRRSVEKALARVGAAPTITNDHDVIRAADGLVVPGVGAFPRAMANLAELGLDALLREQVDAGVPTIVFGPGSINQAHVLDEHVEIAQVTKAALMLVAAARSTTGKVAPTP